MNQHLAIPDRPTTTIGLLQEDVLRLTEQLNDGATAILAQGIVLASGANRIKHNLRKTPRTFHLTPYSSVTWYRTSAPDAEFLYITTGGALTADLFVWI